VTNFNKSVHAAYTAAIAARNALPRDLIAHDRKHGGGVWLNALADMNRVVDRLRDARYPSQGKR
jgi:hypothetical protein